jgi:hypothetical protein
MRRVRLAHCFGAFVALASVGCTFDEHAVGVQPQQVVVHAVLDPGAPTQEVLLERTLTGTVTINYNIRFDPLDPINTGDGIPIAGAQVSITGPDGTLIGLERKYTGKPDSYGTGRYEIQAGLGNKVPIRPGAVYLLNVRSPEGAVVTGTTVVPNAAPVIPGLTLDAFNRDRDTLRLTWNKVPGARTYGARVESPFGAFLIFSDTTNLMFPGNFRNLFAGNLQKLFIPGFQQISTVYAVDTNYFDYYRSRNDPFTGSGIINRLHGGIGLFGASVIVDYRTQDVTQQPSDTTIERQYEFVTGPPQPKLLVDVFRLYVESGNATAASLSGWYSRNRTGPARDGIAGTRDGARIELQFLVNQDIHQTLVRFIGTQVADSLVGSYSNMIGRVVFKRRP